MKPPIDLSPEGVEIWNSAIKAMTESEKVTPNNAMMFALDCERIGLYLKTLRKVSCMAHLHYAGPNGAKCQEPDLKTLREFDPIMAKIRRQWGMTPFDAAMLAEQQFKADMSPADLEDEAFNDL